MGLAPWRRGPCQNPQILAQPIELAQAPFDCGAPPSAFDRLLATRLGVNAVKSLRNGETGVLAGYQKNEVTRTPLADIVGRTKPIDTELVELARNLAK